MEFNPVNDFAKVPALVMYAEVGHPADRAIVSVFDQHGRNIAIAHQIESQSLYAVVDMHATSDWINEIPRVDDVLVVRIVISCEEPCVLTDHILIYRQ